MEPSTPTDAASVDSKTAPKLTEKVFEIKAVDKEASSLLETVNDVNGQLDAAKELRRQKSCFLSDIEKRLIENAFDSTERALADVAGLVEPCRVSTKTENGEIGLVFVLRDSPRIQTSLSQLGLSSQRLQTALNILCNRDISQQSPTSQSSLDSRPPPTYEESQFLTESRTRNMLRKASNNMPFDEAFQRRRLGSNMGSLLEHGEPDAFASASQAMQSPQSERDELFFESVNVQSPDLSTSYRYVPYKPGFSSPSMSSLGSRASTSGVLMPGLAYPDTHESDGLAEASARHRGFTYPTLVSDQTAMKHEALRQGAQSPAVSVVDGFEGTQRRMEERPSLERARFTASWSPHHRPQLSEYGVLPRNASAQSMQQFGTSVIWRPLEARVRPESLPSSSNTTQVEPKPWSPSSMPTVPTVGLSQDCLPIRPPSRPPPPPPTPIPIPMPSCPDDPALDTSVLPKQLELPRHITSREPAMSATDLNLQGNVESAGDEHDLRIAGSSPRKTKDWESLPSQRKRDSMPSTFIVACDSPELAPKPLFHSMVKLEMGTEETGTVQQISIGLARKPVPVSPAKALKALKPLLESEFPEVVTIGTVPMAIHPPSPGSDLPELVLQQNNELEKMTVVTGVSADMLKRTRTQRQREAQHQQQGEDAPELALCSPRENAPEVLISKSTSTVKRAPPIPPKPRRVSKASSTPSLPSLTAISVPGLKPPPVPKTPEPVSGRARSQRWRELQFERSQLLPNSLS